MKQTIYILTVTLLLLSCSSKSRKTVDKVSADTLKKISADKMQSDIYVKDKSQYDQSFIDGLSGYKEPIKLIENYVLIGQDTVYFPEDIQLNKETIFKGTKDQRSFVLNVTRTNLTSLSYKFELFNKEKQLLNSKSGKATLGSLFFIGSESDTDDESGNGYLSTEYWDNSSECSFAIRIGEKDNKGKLRAKIILYCENNKSNNINLDENPTMRTE